MNISFENIKNPLNNIKNNKKRRKNLWIAYFAK